MKNSFYSIAFLFLFISPLFAKLLQTKYTIQLDDALSLHIADRQISENWILGGEASVLASDILRLTDLQSHRSGWIHSTKTINHERWTTELVYRISGGLTGGEGMVFWVLDDAENKPPSLLEKYNWRGLAVVLDTNMKSGKSELSVVYSDGTSAIAPLTDEHKIVLGSCKYEPRNAEQSIIRVTYEGDEIGVNTTGLPTWMDCMSAPFTLPAGDYRLAVSAATGDASDFHYLMKIWVYGLDLKGERPATPVLQAPKVTKAEPKEQSLEVLKPVVEIHRDLKKKYQNAQIEMQEVTTKIHANTNTMRSIISKYESLVGSSQSAEARVAFKGDVVSPETGFSPEDEKKMKNALGELRHLALEKLESVVEKALQDFDKLFDQFDSEDWEYRKASSSHKNTKLWQTEQLKNVPQMYESSYTWMYYVFIGGFEAAWIFAMFFWRKHTVNKAKKSQ